MTSDNPYITISKNLNQSYYIPAIECGRPDMREVVDSVITESQRKYEEALLFTANGLRATLLNDDLVHAQLLDKYFKPEHWNLLSYALDIDKTHIVGGMDLDLPFADHFEWACKEDFLPFKDHLECASEEDIRSNECTKWLVKLHTLKSNYSGSYPHPFCSEYLDDRTFRLDLNVWRIVHWLYRANAVVTHIEPLYAEKTSFTLHTLKERGEDITHLYEALRPAADLWRAVPYEAISPFEELAAARDLINGFDHLKLFELALQVSVRGVLMDDNEGHNNRFVRKWWEWTDTRFEYCVHYGLNPFSTKWHARALHEFIVNACMAFDPANPVNAKVLSILNKGHTSKNSVIIKNQAGAYASLCEYREHLKQVIDAIDADVKPTEFIRPKQAVTSALHLYENHTGR